MSDRDHALELLNAAHEFPCTYTFKVIGLATDDFVGRVVAVVVDTLACPTNPPFRIRETPGGRHVSVTIEPCVENAEQVLLVYERIRTVDGVHMAM